MAERLLSILRIYWSVLCAIVGGVLWLVFWSILNLVFSAIIGSSTDTRDTDTSGGGAGIGWLFYAIGAFALVLVLRVHGAPGWLIDLAIAAAVLGVLPIQWAFNRGRPQPGRL